MNVTVEADTATLQATADIYTTSLEPVMDNQGLICSLTFQPYAESLFQNSASQGGEVLGREGKTSGSLVNLLLFTYWSIKCDDHAILGAMKTALEGINKSATSKGTKVDHVYMNYASEGQDVIDSYGSENKKFCKW